MYLTHTAVAGRLTLRMAIGSPQKANITGGGGRRRRQRLAVGVQVPVRVTVGLVVAVPGVRAISIHFSETIVPVLPLAVRRNR